MTESKENSDVLVEFYSHLPQTILHVPLDLLGAT